MTAWSCFDLESFLKNLFKASISSGDISVGALKAFARAQTWNTAEQTGRTLISLVIVSRPDTSSGQDNIKSTALFLDLIGYLVYLVSDHWDLNAVFPHVSCNLPSSCWLQASGVSSQRNQSSYRLLIPSESRPRWLDHRNKKIYMAKNPPITPAVLRLTML